MSLSPRRRRVLPGRALVLGLALASAALGRPDAAAQADPAARCDAGDAEGCLELGLQRAEAGDAAGRVTAYHRACELGHALACNDLGTYFQGGEGVAQSDSKALQSYRRACDGGFALGCFNLAWMITEG